MNKGLFGNRNNNKYDQGEIIFSIDSPGADYIKLDGSIVNSTVYKRGINKTFYSKFLKSLRQFPNSLIWTTQTSNFGSSSINRVAYGNNLWVAGGSGGQIRTSTDGVTWVTRTSNFGSTFINSVAYGNNLWVAVGDTGQIRTSTDGVTWATQTSNFGSTSVLSVAYGNNLWVVGGSAAQMRTSTDGVTWVTRTPTSGTPSIQSLAYGNGLWVFGASDGQIRASTDAITWVGRTSNFGTSPITSVAYGNNLWIAGSAGQIRTSTDTITWVTRTFSSLPSAYPYSISYGNGLWIAACLIFGNTPPFFLNTGELHSSTDGVTWATQTSNFGSTGIRSIAYGNDLWVVGGENGLLITTNLKKIKSPEISYAWVKS